MPLNDANIFRYNFSSKSNRSWNFQLQFLRGDNVGYDVIDDLFLPDMIIDDITILSDFEDDLPFGKQKASLLNLKVDFGVLQGDFSVLKDWLLIGGQFISNEFYPNQFRVLSNNGRGASDVTFDVIEFWGCQDVIPEQEYTFEFGKSQTFELKILSLDNFILNKISNFNAIGKTLSSSVIIDYHYFAGTNSSSQSVVLGTYSGDSNTLFYYSTAVNIMTWLNTQIQYIAGIYLRGWCNTIDNTNTFLSFWDFNEQLYDLTTQVGSSLTTNSEVLFISEIEVGGNSVGGLCNEKSKDGFYQFKNANDLLNSLCEQFIIKLTFKYAPTGTPKLNLRFKPCYDSLDGGSISLSANDISGELKLIRGSFAIAESTVSYKAYKENQNKNVYKVYGSLKQDSFDNKALFTNNVQVGTIDDFYSVRFAKLPYHLINQLYYYNSVGDNYVLTHANCSVDLGTETSKVISNEITTGDTIDPNDNKSTGNKTKNREKLILWANQRYNKSGLNYVQSKAYNSIMNDKSILIECETLDYKIRPIEVGQLLVSDFGTMLDMPSEWFFTTNHIVTSCELNLLNGISKVKIFVRGE